MSPNHSLFFISRRKFSRTPEHNHGWRQDEVLQIEVHVCIPTCGGWVQRFMSRPRLVHSHLTDATYAWYISTLLYMRKHTVSFRLRRCKEEMRKRTLIITFSFPARCVSVRAVGEIMQRLRWSSLVLPVRRSFRYKTSSAPHAQILQYYISHRLAKSYDLSFTNAYQYCLYVKGIVQLFAFFIQSFTRWIFCSRHE